MSEEIIPTSEKLAQALEAANAPREMIEKARAKYYDDYLSPLTDNMRQLVADARKHGLKDIADRAIDGDFDGTREESDAWAKSPEGRETFAQFLKPPGPNRKQRRSQN